MMENYTSDSSDSESTSKTIDLSYLMLDVQILHEHLVCVTSPEQVETLLLHQNRISHLPESIARFSNLATLDLSNCGLQRLPDFLLELTQLVYISAKNNSLTNETLPKSLENLLSLRELNLSGNRLTEFPLQVLDLPGLRYLYLGGNYISEITEDVWKIQRPNFRRAHKKLVIRLIKCSPPRKSLVKGERFIRVMKGNQSIDSFLQVLSMGGNRLTEVPSTLGQLTALQALVLCDNRLESLPSSIANLKNLKSLLLHKNRLRTLPTEIITLKCLTELSLRDNPLVVRFVSDMTHNPPSLLELAARVVKTIEIPYREEDLPRNLIDYLNSGHRCVNSRCKGVFFDNRIEHVKFVDFCGKYRLPLLQYLCSSKCIGPREGDEEVVSGAMIRKVLLG